MVEEMYSRGLAHVGLTVPDIEAATEWYQNVLGFSVIMGPAEVPNEGFLGRQVSDLLGDFETMKIVHMATGNQVGVELFEFDQTEGNSDQSPFSPGYFHMCVIDPNPGELAQHIEENGGDAYSDVWGVLEEDGEYRTTYCRDPWGNFLEVFSTSDERAYSNQE